MQPSRLREAWGVRLGVLAVPEYPGAHPLLEPYYESATSDSGGLTMTADLTIAYTDFARIQFPTYDPSDGLVDYGFHGGVRYVPKQSGTISYFGAAELGVDVYPDPISPDPGRVSVSAPLTFGALYDVSHRTELEFAVVARPVWFFRQAWGFSYAVVIGGRFLSFSE